MTCTLRHTGTAYRRYVSPSRLPVTSGTPIPHQTPATVVPQHGLGTSPPNQSWPIIQGHLLKHRQHVGVQSSQTELYSTKNRSVELSAMMKVLGNVNLDLPKAFTLPKKLFRMRNEDTVKSDLVPHVDAASVQKESVLKVDNSNTKAMNSEITKNEQVKLKIDSVEREQHDLLSALVEKDESIKTYLSQHHHVQSNGAKTAPESGNASSSSSTRENAVNLVRTITNYIPGLSGTKASDGTKEPSKAVTKKALNKHNVIPRNVLDRKTRGVVRNLRTASSSASKLVRMEELCRHLTSYPEAKNLAVKEKVVPCLLRLRHNKDAGLREQAMQALALVGYTDPVKGRGIRILSIDGGGTRGLVSIEILRRLEEASQTSIFNLFDYICGVSTGCLIGILLGIHRVSLDEAERLYKTFSREIFQRHKLKGVSKLVMSQAYYDAQLWEKILQDNVGTQTFLESTRDSRTPKVACVSTLMNLTKLSNFLFRNYNHGPGLQSSLPGSSKYQLWEAVRASSAAPMYYEEFKLDQWVHQDGGIITNNPTAIAVHEAKLLWPNTPLQCVVSIGTGRYEPTAEPDPTGTGLRKMINKIIQSATDTEAVHTTLNDLLPPSTYFRFNPYMSEEFTLDEIRPASWNQMTLDTQLYCRKNQNKINTATAQLLQPKQPHQKAQEWVRSKVNEYI